MTSSVEMLPKKKKRSSVTLYKSVRYITVGDDVGFERLLLGDDLCFLCVCDDTTSKIMFHPAPFVGFLLLRLDIIIIIIISTKTPRTVHKSGGDKESNIFFSSVPQMMIAGTIAITIATKHLLTVHPEEMQKLIVTSFFHPLSGNNIVVVGSINYRNRR